MAYMRHAQTALLALTAGLAFDSSALADCSASAPINDPCLVHSRSVSMRSHPQDAWNAECMGMKVFEDPQPPGHPMPLAECDKRTREDQARLGLPSSGMSAEQKDAYRRAWGNR